MNSLKNDLSLNEARFKRKNIVRSVEITTLENGKVVCPYCIMEYDKISELNHIIMTKYYKNKSEKRKIRLEDIDTLKFGKNVEFHFPCCGGYYELIGEEYQDREKLKEVLGGKLEVEEVKGSIW